jgi:DNA-binding GntR family transcriptional regulator
MKPIKNVLSGMLVAALMAFAPSALAQIMQISSAPLRNALAHLGQ